MLNFSLWSHLLFFAAVKLKYSCLKKQIWSVKLVSQSKRTHNSKRPQLSLKAYTS